MTKITMAQLNTMDYDAINAYERKLGFIAPIYSAIAHRDNVRETTPDYAADGWKCSWTFDTATQREYFRMVSKARGWFIYDLPDSESGKRLESRLEPKPN